MYLPWYLAAEYNERKIIAHLIACSKLLQAIIIYTKMADQTSGWKYVAYEIAMTVGQPVVQQNFLINNYLVDRPIWAIEVYSSLDIANSPISTANVVWTPAQMLQASLTLYCFDPNDPTNAGAKAEWIKNLPVNTLHRNFNTATAGTSSVFARTQFNGIKIDFNNSFIKFAVAPALTANTSALFGVYYG